MQLELIKIKKWLRQWQALEALVAELKVMIHLGSHLNIVNLLGIYTKGISKGKNLIKWDIPPEKWLKLNFGCR